MADQDMLINYVPGEECRIAIVEGGKLEELYTERASDELHVGNIYRGKITNVEPSIQAAFIDFGIDRHGFLHISDLHPRYFNGADATERVGKRTPRRDRPPIQQCLKRGQHILVQVLKEGIGTKGPTLTSYLSIPGRFLVMMPDMEHSGVSRKVEDDSQRRELRKILDELELPEGFGFIVRTAGFGRTKTEMKRDLAYLMRLWKTIERRMNQGKGPAELYRESDLIIRTLRDVLSNDIKRIVIDDLSAARRARDFMRIAMPRGAAKVYYYDRPIPLLDAFDIERQIAVINEREVPLPSGGSLVIDSTEAMVTVDVNSGKYRDKSDAEATAFHTNCEAVDEIARQLRLRDLGGVVCLDLIDMYQQKNRREIERRFKDHLKKDRARSKTLKINELGLLSLTRQRMRPSLKRSLHEVCPTCDGASVVKTGESVVLDVMRQLAVVMSGDSVVSVELTITPEVGAVLMNRKRAAMHQLEQQLRKTIKVEFDSTLSPDEVQITAFDARGARVDIEKLPRPKKPRFSQDDEVDAAEKRYGVTDEDSEGQTDAWADFDDTDAEESDAAAAAPAEDSQDQAAGESGKKRRRRRRKRKSDGGGQETQAGESPSASTTDEQPPVSEAQAEAEAADRSEIAVEQFEEDGTTEVSDAEEQPVKKKRRRRRGGRKHRRRREAERAEEEGKSNSQDGSPPDDTLSRSDRENTPRDDEPRDSKPAEGGGEQADQSTDDDKSVRVFEPSAPTENSDERQPDVKDKAKDQKKDKDEAKASVDPESSAKDTDDASSEGTTKKRTRRRSSSSSSGSGSKRTTKKQSKKTTTSRAAKASADRDDSTSDEESAGQ